MATPGSSDLPVYCGTPIFPGAGFAVCAATLADGIAAARPRMAAAARLRFRPSGTRLKQGVQALQVLSQFADLFPQLVNFLRN